MDEARQLATELAVLERGAGQLRLADCIVLVAGKGHREALQRVVSQDVLALRPGEGKLALLLAPKGQFRAIMRVFAGDEQSYLMAPSGRAGELAASLGKYLMLSRCTAEPLVDTSAFAILGGDFRQAAAGAGLDAARLESGGWLGASGVLCFGGTLLGIPGAVVAAREPATLASVEGWLAASGAAPVSEDAVELERIRVGWPAWGAELTETVLPPEVGIEDETISYTKGCYVGQETIARMKTYGHPNRELVGLHQLSGSAERPTLPLPLMGVGDAKTGGSLTSWAHHPERGGVALALVRRQLADPGARLTGEDREFEVAPLPLW